MRAAKRCPPTMSIARSAACRLRSRPSLPRSPLIFPICARRCAHCEMAVERSRRCRETRRFGLGRPRASCQRPQPVDRSQAARAAVCARRRFIHQRPARPARRRCRAAGATADITHFGYKLADMTDTAAVAGARGSHDCGRYVGGPSCRRHGTRGLGYAALLRPIGAGRSRVSAAPGTRRSRLFRQARPAIGRA